MFGFSCLLGVVVCFGVFLVCLVFFDYGELQRVAQTMDRCIRHQAILRAKKSLGVSVGRDDAWTVQGSDPWAGYMAGRQQVQAHLTFDVLGFPVPGSSAGSSSQVGAAAQDFGAHVPPPPGFLLGARLQGLDRGPGVPQGFALQGVPHTANVLVSFLFYKTLNLFQQILAQVAFICLFA